MRVFGIELDPTIIEAIAAHGERDYPNEACGVALGLAGGDRLVRVVPLKNVQDRYHAKDPVRFPRDSRDAFRIDELERMRVLEAAEKEGLVERVLYHSHCEAGAYFSPEDRAMAVRDGAELLPGVVNVVVSIRSGKRADMACFRFDAASGAFEEERLGPFEPREPTDLPDLEARAMEGTESARPIAPAGRGLVRRRVTEGERAKIAALAQGRRVHLSEDQARDVVRFGLGLLSPLNGFMRAAEIASVRSVGRLLSGTPWRSVLELWVDSDGAEEGAVVELIDPSGEALGAIGVDEIEQGPKKRVRIGGPVFVYPAKTSPGPDAAETRAEILRRQMSRVLAIPSRAPAARVRATDLSKFDGVLATAANAPGSPPRLPLVLPGADPWLDALMAQNLGATHIWVEDAGLARTITETLQIQPFGG